MTVKARRGGVRLKVAGLALGFASIVSTQTACVQDGGDGASSGDTIGELTWALTPVESLDMDKSLTTNGLTALALSLEGLTKLDNEGHIVPALAKSYEQVDELTYRYHLRPGVTFWDGSPVTTEDVIFSLRRHMSETSGAASQYASVKSVEAQGSDTIVFHLKYPDVSLPIKMSVVSQVYKKSYVEEAGGDFGTSEGLIMGTGPWKITSFQPDASIEYVGNDNWWGGDVHIDQISIKLVEEPGDAALGMRAGEIDGIWYTGANGTVARQFENISGVDQITGPNADMNYIYMNVTKPPFDDLHVRRAIAHLVDKDGIVSSAVGGFAEPLRALTPPTLLTPLATEDEIDDAFSSIPEYAFDVDAARDELARSEYPDGFEADLRVSSAQTSWVTEAQILADNASKIGITLNIEETPVGSWTDGLFAHRYGLQILSGGGFVPDPAVYINSYLPSANAVQNGLNWADYRNDTVDRLLEQQAGEQDEAARLNTIIQILTQVAEDAVYLPVYVAKAAVSLNSNYEFSGSTFLFYQHPWALDISN